MARMRTSSTRISILRSSTTMPVRSRAKRAKRILANFKRRFSPFIGGDLASFAAHDIETDAEYDLTTFDDATVLYMRRKQMISISKLSSSPTSMISNPRSTLSRLLPLTLPWPATLRYAHDLERTLRQ